MSRGKGATGASWCKLLVGAGVGHARLVHKAEEKKRPIGLLVFARPEALGLAAGVCGLIGLLWAYKKWTKIGLRLGLGP